MLRTLHGYVTRDLLRVMLLTLVALTLLMTVLAIIQPLRNVGLGGTQVLHLFIFTMPVMLSFTLPVATLFSATLVYGRFAQDNELLACRASGVSTLSLLRPALVLGAFVTMVSLTLSNVVAPSLSTMAGMVQANFRGILYQRLKTDGYIEMGRATGGTSFTPTTWTGKTTCCTAWCTPTSASSGSPARRGTSPPSAGRSWPRRRRPG